MSKVLTPGSIFYRLLSFKSMQSLMTRRDLWSPPNFSVILITIRIYSLCLTSEAVAGAIVHEPLGELWSSTDIALALFLLFFCWLLYLYLALFECLVSNFAAVKKPLFPCSDLAVWSLALAPSPETQFGWFSSASVAKILVTLLLPPEV